MAFIPVPNVVKAVLTGHVGAHPWAHVLHYQYSGGAPTAAQLQSGSLVLLNQFNSHIWALCSDVALLESGQLVDLGSQTGAEGVSTGSHPGVQPGSMMPANCAMLITKAINRRYRGGHPRAYIAGLPTTAQQSESTWTASVTTAFANGYAAFITATANGGLWGSVGAEVTVHRILDKIVLTTPIVDIVQSYTSEQGMASQRRRIGRK